MKKVREKLVKTKAVIYIRVSSKRQVENMSLGEQRRICKDFCYQHQLEVNDERIFEERGESAKTAERHELQRMLQYCTQHRKEVGAVVVYKLDRFSRRVEDHTALRAVLRKLDIQLLSASEPIGGGTNTDALMENILASFAQFDNDVRGERARNGLRAASLEGGWVSQAPIGYLNTKTEAKQPTLVAVEHLRKPIRQFFREFAKGQYVQEEAAMLAHRSGVRTNKGTVVSRNGAIKMLRAIVYTGNVQNKATDNRIIKGLHEPIVDFETFQKVQDVLSGRQRPDDSSNGYRVKNPFYPLRRFLVCSLCDKPLTAGENTGKTRKYKAYHCHRCTIKKDGARVSIPQDKAHELFEAQLSSAEPQSWVPDVFREIVLRRWNDEFKTAQKALNAVDKQLQDIKANKSRLVDLLIEKKISDDAYTEKENAYVIQRAQLESERKELQVKEENRERIVDNAARFLIDLPKSWREMSLENRQKFQTALFTAKIVVYPNQTFGTPQFSPIIEQVTDMEEYFSKNKVDLPERKSTMADYRVKDWNSLKQELIRWYELLGQIGAPYEYSTNGVH